MNKQDWTYKTFGEVFDLQMGRTPDRKNPSLFGGDNIWVSIRDIDGKYIEDSKEHITNEAVVNSGIKLVKKGTVIMSFKLTVGKCAIARKDLYTNEAIMAFNVNKGFILDSSFLYYYLQGYRWSGTNKAVMGLTLNKATISKQKIAIPPIGEQERIVAELDLLQGIIEKKKEQLKAYDQLAQSIFYSMFGDPIDNPKGWETTKLKDITTKIGSGATPKGGNQSYKNEGISLIRSLNVHNGSFKYEDLAHIDEQQAHQLNNVIVEENDVLFNITGASVARCCIVPFDVLPARVNQHVSILRPKKEIVNHVYLCYYLISPNSQNALLVMSKSNAATREALPKSMMEKYSICVPPLSLQQEFAEKVEAIERQKALVQESIEETQTMFDCTMDKYFG